MSLFLLVTAAAATPDLTICPDRPSKANGPCTVPPGHWQLEVSGVDWTRTLDAGTRSDTTSAGSTFVKYGLNNGADLEVGFSPFVHLSSSNANLSGVGDTVIRIKQRLTASDAWLQAAVLPFMKLPSARHPIGNGSIEGGIAVPLSTNVSRRIAITIGPEVDVVADASADGHHVALVNLANVAFAVTPKWSVSAEIWNNQNFDPAGTQRQWSADASAAFQPTNRVQLDAGANFGLNRATPTIELYTGLSMLF